MAVSKTIFLPIAFILFAGIYMAVLWDRHILHADQQTCAVYQGLYSDLTNQDAVFFEGISQPYAYFPSEYVPEAPTEFSRDTGHYKEIELAAEVGRLTVPIRESFEHDTSEYFSAVAKEKKQRIRGCFKELENAPGIFSGSFEVLHARESLLQKDDEGFVFLWRVSPVGFSGNGRFAVMYADYYCGGLCGWGGFVLLEKVAGDWVVVGDKTLWVS